MKPSKIMAVLVSAATLSSTAGMTAFAADNSKKAADNKYSYVALGDSIAAGFGLAGGDLAQDPALIITDELLADPVKELILQYSRNPLKSLVPREDTA